MGNFMDFGDVIGEVPGMGGALASAAIVSVLYVILLVIMVVAFYVVTAYKWQFIGRKAGLQKDWMPFVPFARTVYKLSIVDEQWWKMFFLDGWWLYAAILNGLLGLISFGFGITVTALYLLCCLAYNTYWRFKFYMAHNIRPHFSLTVLVLPLAIIRMAWDYMIAFGRNYPFTGEGTSRAVMDVVNVPQMRDEQGRPVSVTRAVTPAERGAPWAGSPAEAPRRAPAAPAAASGSVTGLSGMYAGQAIPLASGEEMVIGRDNALSNLIVDQNADKVSRKHCGIIYNASSGTYQVTDYSTNGTFVDGGSRLVANIPTTLARGTVIALGSKENRFKLS